MNLDGENPVGRYNLGLLVRAAERHIESLQREVRSERCRDDFWELAGRPVGAPDAWDAALCLALFPDRSLTRWVDLAEHFFASKRPVDAHQGFWNASRGWLESVAGYGHWTATWRKWARSLCDALAEREIPVIPVSVENGLTSVPLPSRQERGRPARRRVFFRAAEGAEVEFEMPGPLLAQGRSVTGFDLGPFEEPAGVARFNSNEVLRDLRQVPNDPSKLDAGTPLSGHDQAALLRFARHLRPSSGVSHFAWRAFTELDDAQRVGRAIATLFLPTVDGYWEPARQLSRDRVDVARLEAMGLNLGEADDFLEWLGVARSDAVPLVERGAAGLIAPLDEPPALQGAGTDEIGVLEPLLDRRPTIEGVIASLHSLPPDSARSRVFAAVASTPWLPSSMFRESPAGIEPLPERVAPHDVVLSVKDVRSVFFAVPSDLDDVDNLRELGALDGLESKRAHERAHDLARQLRARCPNPDTLSASLSTRLAALLDALMQGMPLNGDAMPVLIEQAGRYRWRIGSEPAWLARRDERQELRRFYPDLPLVAGAYRKGLAEDLRVGEVRLHKQVMGTGAPSATPLAETLRRRIDPAVRVLCAIADQSRQARVDADHVRRAWLRQEPLLQVDDAWVRLSVVGPNQPEKPWRKGVFDDVFHLPDSDDAEPGVILFDTRPTQDSGPPLRHFGEPLARLLVGNALLGPLFAEVLAAVEEDALQDFVERRHLGDAAAEWERELRPLSDQQRARLEEHVAVVCRDARDVLRRGRVRPADVRTDLGLGTGADVHDLLHMDIDGSLVDHLPRVLIANEHQRTWAAWLERWLRPFEAWLAHRSDLDTDWLVDLESHVRARLDQLDFAPARAVTDWLSSRGLRVAELEAELDAFGVRFMPVLAAPTTVTAAGWTAGRGQPGTATGGPERKLELLDVIDENIAKAAWGDAAERALLHWVVQQTAPLLTNPTAQETLLSVFPARSRTRRQVEEHLRAGEVEPALHVAQFWSGAGYDILGLELDKGELVPVRYECKGLPAKARTIRVFLSRRELAVARAVRREGPGVWKLMGVEPLGHCVDLTGLIEDLLDADAGLLAPLHARGIEEDGLRLVVQRR